MPIKMIQIHYVIYLSHHFIIFAQRDLIGINIVV